jgi:hypothetical protein
MTTEIPHVPYIADKRTRSWPKHAEGTNPAPRDTKPGAK